MKHSVYLAAHFQRAADVMLDEFKCGLIEQMLDVSALSGNKIIYAQDFVALCDEPVAEV